MSESHTSHTNSPEDSQDSTPNTDNKQQPQRGTKRDRVAAGLPLPTREGKYTTTRPGHINRAATDEDEDVNEAHDRWVARVDDTARAISHNLDTILATRYSHEIHLTHLRDEVRLNLQVFLSSSLPGFLGSL